MIKRSCWKGQALFFIIMAFRSEQWAECTNTKLALTDCYLCDRLGAASHPTRMTFHKPENYKTPLFFYNMQPCMQQLSCLLCVSTAVPGIVNMAIKQICCHRPLRGSDVEVEGTFLPAWNIGKNSCWLLISFIKICVHNFQKRLNFFYSQLNLFFYNTN